MAAPSGLFEDRTSRYGLAAAMLGSALTLASFVDDDVSIANAYSVFAGVPDTILIDREGRIAARFGGWNPQWDEPLMRMRLAKLADAPVPLLLSVNGYSGSEVCGVCHETERATWLLTSHASAFDTLVRHAADTDAACSGAPVDASRATTGLPPAMKCVSGTATTYQVPKTF